jgi:glyoxylase-like metal-dependent hydrolase (beta-lactamase superfamily II)
MSHQIPITSDAIADLPHPDDATREIAADLAYKRLAMVNVVFYGLPKCGDRKWVLIDAGLTGLTGLIESAAEERFGAGARPSAILLTHGHSDHVGGLEKLAAQWDVPIFAHPLEVPYLNGTASYPPADAWVGGGIMPFISKLFPLGPIDVSRRLHALPADVRVPHMPGWRWLHTPGHAAGHISLWRESDRALIVGDAFITTNMESAYSVATQEEELHGPPQFLTHDWEAARQSVQALAALDPEVVITGHGRAMRGPKMRAALRKLASHFDQIAVPRDGHYVSHPARAEDGSAYREP